ncbi:HlyD family type I secretion periplasmic adaptor subunit [Pseudoduganella sp. OTU4001]|uniref:HlyD family type I secretion periplasmic adaptor subunit n=1 Tax=Pseudoduganella sp. OTU4001 TaxID=3043854 RepID=UPI00313C61EE
MEPANKPPVKRGDETRVDFLPDADAIERMPLPSYLRITLHLLAGVFLVFILWAIFSKVEKVVMAPGRLVNTVPNIVVQPLETSLVQRIEVRAGQVVKKGQLLATLDPTFTQADEAQLRSRLQSLQNQEKSLRAELTGKAAPAGKLSSADDILQAQLSNERQANFEAQKNRLDQTIERLKASMETNKRDQQVLAQRLKSLSEIEAMQEKLLAENFGAKMHLLEARDRRLEVERSLVMGRNRDAELARELGAAEAERAAFNKGWRQKSMEDLLGATRERDSIAEQLAKADKRHQLVQLTAPADAVVLEVGKLSPGSVVQAAEKMFVLVPLHGQLEAEVFIDASDIGGIKVGDTVHVKLSAYPFQQHGMLEGKVRTISRDAFQRDQAPPGAPSDSYYISRIELGPNKLRNMPPNTQLLPGMTLNGEVVVGKRSVMSYLLWPLTKALDESIREP